MGKTIYITEKEADAIFFAEDTLRDAIEGWADEENAKIADEHRIELWKLYLKFKKTKTKTKN